MIRYGFYNGSDRLYDAIDIGRLFSGVINDGVFMDVGQKFLVTVNSDMTVTVGTGKAWFNNTWIENDGPVNLVLEQSEALLNRIDSIVLDFDASVDVRQNSIKILKGTPASSPLPPTMIATTYRHTYELARIRVNAGVKVINTSDITIMVGTTNTPYVRGILEIVSVDTLFARWTDEWNRYYAAQSKSMTDHVTALQNQSTTLYNDVDRDVRNVLTTIQNDGNTLFNTIRTNFNTAYSDQTGAMQTTVENFQNDYTTKVAAMQTTVETLNSEALRKQNELTELMTTYIENNQGVWHDWFETIRTDLSDTPVGNLENILNAIRANYGPTYVSVGRKELSEVGDSSFAFGVDTTASGEASHAEGNSTKASGEASHAEGYATTASDEYSHAEGNSTTASGSASHAEGNSTTASGSASHAEGNSTIASGHYSHAEGVSIAGAKGGHSEGMGTISSVGIEQVLEIVSINYADMAIKIIRKDFVNTLNIGDPIITIGYTRSDDIIIDKSIITRISDPTDPEQYIYVDSIQDKRYLNRFAFIPRNADDENIIIGNHAEGILTAAINNASHAEGYSTIASGASSHAEGSDTLASGMISHAEGKSTTASGYYSHAEGYNTKAIDTSSHVEGYNTTASGKYSHAEGLNTTASGSSSHAEGNSTTASGSASHAEGNSTTASGYYSHAEGSGTKASGDSSHSEGVGTIASGSSSHAEGYNTKASGCYSHAEGCKTFVNAPESHSEGSGTSTSTPNNTYVIDYIDKNNNNIIISKTDTVASLDDLSIGDKMLFAYFYRDYDDVSYKELTITAINKTSKAITFSDLNEINFQKYRPVLICLKIPASIHGMSHAEGFLTAAGSLGSHSEGSYTTAVGDNSHAEGISTIANSSASHAEGYMSWSGNMASHAEGFVSGSSGMASHAEGNSTTASGSASHAEGNSTTASGSASHAEGNSTTARGDNSHAEGYNTKASGDSSHAGGYFTTALDYQYAIGHYNNTAKSLAGVSSGKSTGTAFVIGNGTSATALNAVRIDYNGKLWTTGSYASSGADYAEYFEWEDGNPNDEDRRGLFVTMNGTKIKIANNDEWILGIVSANPAVIGNNDMQWSKMLIQDEYGNYITKNIKEKRVRKEIEYVDCEEVVTETIEEIDETTGEKTIKEVQNTIIIAKPVEKEIEEEVECEFYEVNPEYDPEKPYTFRDFRREWSPIGMLGVLAVRDDGSCKVNGFCKCGKNGIAIATFDRTGYRVIERVNDHIIKVIYSSRY